MPTKQWKLINSIYIKSISSYIPYRWLSIYRQCFAHRLSWRKLMAFLVSNVSIDSWGWKKLFLTKMSRNLKKYTGMFWHLAYSKDMLIIRHKRVANWVIFIPHWSGVAQVKQNGYHIFSFAKKTVQRWTDKIYVISNQYANNPAKPKLRQTEIWTHVAMEWTSCSCILADSVLMRWIQRQIAKMFRIHMEMETDRIKNRHRLQVW